MPSKEFATSVITENSTGHNSNHNNTCTNNSSNSSACSRREMVPREVDELVNEIKQNLRLKGSNSNCGTASVAEAANQASAMLAKCFCSNGYPANNNYFYTGMDARASSAAVVLGGGGSVMFRTKMPRSSTRLAPYHVPSKSGGDSGCHSCASPARCHHSGSGRTCGGRRPSDTSDDPYQLLQELLKEGGLIKEAVRRISTKPDEAPAGIVKFYDYDKDEYESGANLIGMEA